MKLRYCYSWGAQCWMVCGVGYVTIDGIQLDAINPVLEAVDYVNPNFGYTADGGMLFKADQLKIIQNGKVRFDFNAMWEPNEAQVKLENRLADYYRETEGFSNHKAYGYRKALARWCDENGYTHEEVNRAKKAVSGWAEFSDF